MGVSISRQEAENLVFGKYSPDAQVSLRIIAVPTPAVLASSHRDVMFQPWYFYTGCPFRELLFCFPLRNIFSPLRPSFKGSSAGYQIYCHPQGQRLECSVTLAP